MQQANQKYQNFGLAPEPNMPQQKITNIIDITDYKKTDLP